MMLMRALPTEGNKLRNDIITVGLNFQLLEIDSALRTRFSSEY